LCLLSFFQHTHNKNPLFENFIPHPHLYIMLKFTRQIKHIPETPQGSVCGTGIWRNVGGTRKERVLSLLLEWVHSVAYCLITWHENTR
jgi:hypothetical protein